MSEIKRLKLIDYGDEICREWHDALLRAKQEHKRDLETIKRKLSYANMYPRETSMDHSTRCHFTHKEIFELIDEKISQIKETT